MSRITAAIVSAVMSSTLYSPMTSSWGSRSRLSHRMHIASCSLFDSSVHSSHMIDMNLDWSIEDAISRKIVRAITFKSSFCISCDMYLSVFFASHSAIRESSSPRNFMSWKKFESWSSLLPRVGRPCLARNLRFERIFSRHSLFSCFWLLSSLDRSSPTSLHVLGSVTMTSWASR